jgi:hypothetical protein
MIRMGCLGHVVSAYAWPVPKINIAMAMKRRLAALENCIMSKR